MWNIRNFTRHDANILNPRINKFNGGKDNILRYEFPIMQWCISKVQLACGEDIKYVRVSLFLIGLFGVTGFFFLMLHIIDDWLVAGIAASLLQFSPVFYYYTINPIPDNLALACSIWYLVFILKYFKNSKFGTLFVASLFLLLATLAKLPFLMFSIVSITHFCVRICSKKKITSNLLAFAGLQLLLISPAIVWYIWVIPTWTGNPILNAGLEGFDVKEYFKILYDYHMKVMFPHVLLSWPVWILFILGVVQLFKTRFESFWIFALMFMTILFWLIELKPIGVVHDYYMMPFLPWLYIVVGLGTYFFYKLHQALIIVPFILCFLCSHYTMKKIDPQWDYENSAFNHDLFKYSEELKNIVPNNDQCIILNDYTGYVFSYRIDKMGHIFANDKLPINWIDDIIVNYGIKYMYSDSEAINSNPEFNRYIEDILLVKGSISVFKLKAPKNDIN